MYLIYNARYIVTYDYFMNAMKKLKLNIIFYNLNKKLIPRIIINLCVSL